MGFWAAQGASPVLPEAAPQPACWPSGVFCAETSEITAETLWLWEGVWESLQHCGLLFTCPLDWSMFQVRASPSLQRRGHVPGGCTVVPATQGSGRDPRSPFNLLQSRRAGSCQAAVRAGRACFLLLFAYANKCKVHPSRAMQLLTPLAYGFPGLRIAAAGSTPSLSRGGLGA